MTVRSHQGIDLNALPKLTVVASDPAGDADIGPDPLGLDVEPPSIGDQLLLDAWIVYRDRDALAELINRYRSMVLSVCRRQSRTLEDTEDAFQVTFLTLVRDAERLRKRECLAGWLHQVAYRTACRTRKLNRAAEHLTVDPPDDSTDGRKTLQEIAHRHRLRALDEEVEQLPKKYRDAVVLHYFDGLTYQQAATTLRSTEPAIRGRLGRARARLQRQLSRRGFAFSTVVGSIAMLSENQAVASDQAAAELAKRTFTQCVDSSKGQPPSPNLEPLLIKETPMLFSTTSLATIGALACTAVGLLFAPFGETPAGEQGHPSVQLQGAADALSAELSPIDVSGDPFAERVADPFDAGHSPATPANAKKGNSETIQSPQETSGHWASGNADFHKRIEEALSKPVRYNFEELPLSDVIHEISDDTGIAFRIDERALDEIGMSADDLVNCDVDNISLESALNLVVSSVDLTYTVDNEAVTVTSIECDKDRHQLLRIYWAGETGLQATPSSAALIESLVDPAAWETVGGNSTISILAAEQVANCAFGIRASYTTHRKIERFLQSIKAGSSEPMQGLSIEAFR